MSKPQDRRPVSTRTGADSGARRVAHHQDEHRFVGKNNNHNSPMGASQQIINSPELFEPQPGPDYQRMESPVPSSISVKSYFSRACNWTREFNSLPWVAAGPITVEYNAAKRKVHREIPHRPLLVWENKHVLRSPEVDLTAGESPPVSITKQGSAPDSPSYYTNENGQIWPAVVSSPEGLTPPPLYERGSSPSNLPHANGTLRPVTPPPLHVSPDGTWRVEGSVAPPSWINYHDRDVASIQEVATPDTIGDVGARVPSPSVPFQSRARVGQSPLGNNIVVSSSNRPSLSSHSRLKEESTPHRRSLLRRTRDPLVNPLPRNGSIGRTPRWLSNLISLGSESRSQSRADRHNGLRNSWVEIVNVSTESPYSTGRRRPTEEDRDLQIARALQFEEEGIAAHYISTPTVPPLEDLLNPSFPPDPSPTHFPIVLDNDVQLSSASNHPYSGYVSAQPEGYGQPVHAGHNGYVSSTAHSNATTSPNISAVHDNMI